MGKKFLRGFNVSLLLLIIISMFSSCANEMNIFEGNNNKQINFSVSVPEWKNTDSLSSSKTSRAIPISDTSLSTSNTFNIIADQYDGISSYTTLIDKESVTYTNNIWKTSNNYYWSGTANKTVNFYAYYPTSISGNISHTAGSSPTLLYSVPSDVSNQIDIITAINPNISGSTSTSTPLTFNHIFAAVKFAVGTSGLPSGTIKSITINGIKNSGTYTFGSGWTLGSTTSLFTVSPSKIITGTSGENITSDAFTLMMIPQIFTDADVSLVYNNGTTFSAKISGTWNAGGVYTYNLSKTIVFNYNYTGASQTFTAPYTGTYKIECWGAQGGKNGGYGGYSYGNLYVTKNTLLYICIGGAGLTGSSKSGGNGGYNGGGHGGDGYTTSSGGGGGGGGATHIAITNRGVLSLYKDYSNDIEIVAGGGGGTGWGSGGSGGGISGGKSGGWDDGVGNTSIGLSYGGTQTDGYAFGLGQNGRNSAECIRADDTGNGGGGGGWYGGYSYQATGYSSNDSGGGGSGHLGTSLINGTTGMQNGVRSGDGYARITFVSAN